jgi:hypothetical protein
MQQEMKADQEEIPDKVEAKIGAEIETTEMRSTLINKK